MGETAWLDLALYLVVYGFLGWLVEVICYAATRRRFYNRGLLSMPLILSYGITFDLLIVILPTLHSHFLRYLATLVIASVVESLNALVVRRAAPAVKWDPEWERLFTGTWKGTLASATVAGVYYLVYLMGQPLLMAGVELIPLLVKRAVVIAAAALIAADLVVAVCSLRSGRLEGFQQYQEDSRWRQLVQRVTRAVWRRFNRAYPGIQTVGEEERGSYVFAKGLCMDKLIWVFLTSALLGDIIETLYCGFLGDWMNRSSVLYGPFSFVWGLGAVVLTVTLYPLRDKPDRWIFLAGFVVGGVYEYMCSVFTELVFGTVFWDYSHMPLNIGGRTNVLFCFFWGVLATVWIKALYPAMSRIIEKLPAIAGKVVTWAVLLLMLCNAALTAAAMFRYDTRSVRPESANAFEAFLDRQYPDRYMERRWPNMRVVEQGELQEPGA